MNCRNTCENLTALANRYGTDKGTIYGAAHAYTLVYEYLFAPLRDQPINLLEIGLQAGGPEIEVGAIDRAVTNIPSIQMWHEYFPKATTRTSVDSSQGHIPRESPAQLI